MLLRYKNCFQVCYTSDKYICQCANVAKALATVAVATGNETVYASEYRHYASCINAQKGILLF